MEATTATIEFTESQIEELISYYTLQATKESDEVKIHQKKQSEYMEMVNVLKEKLTTTQSPVVPQLFDNSGSSLIYDKNWPSIKKIIFAMETANKPLTTREIVDMLKIYDPSFSDKKIDEAAIANFSSVLAMKSKSNKIFTRTKGEFDVAIRWGLIRWNEPKKNE